MDYPAALVKLIDDRIDQAALRPAKMGTVQSRESGTARAIVTFDGGSGTGQPVKCFETVVVDIGDRVGLAKVEGEWIIIGSYSPRLFGDLLNGVDMTSTTSTSSGTFVDIPTSPKASFAKYRDDTQLQIMIGVSVQATSAGTIVEIGANIALPDGTSFDQAVFHRSFEAANVSKDIIGGITTPGLTLPGGAYSVTARWRRGFGGSVSMTTNDSCTIWVREVVA